MGAHKQARTTTSFRIAGVDLALLTEAANSRNTRIGALARDLALASLRGPSEEKSLGTQEERRTLLLSRLTDFETRVAATLSQIQVSQAAQIETLAAQVTQIQASQAAQMLEIRSMLASQAAQIGALTALTESLSGVLFGLLPALDAAQKEGSSARSEARTAAILKSAAGRIQAGESLVDRLAAVNLTGETKV